MAQSSKKVRSFWCKGFEFQICKISIWSQTMHIIKKKLCMNFQKSLAPKWMLFFHKVFEVPSVLVGDYEMNVDTLRPYRMLG